MNPTPAKCLAPARHALGWVLACALAACGAGDSLPPLDVPPPARCPPVDVYPADLNAAIDAGVTAGLATVIRERFPEDTRRDFVDSVMRLLTAFEPGAISALAPAPDAPPAEPSQLQPTLARVVRLLVEPAPRDDVYVLTRGVLGTCDGGPLLVLAADLVGDTAFVDALVRLLTSPTLVDTLKGLSFEQENGRDALRYLVRNVFVAATQPTFSIETITGLLGLLVDLDQAPYDQLVRGFEVVLDGEGLEVTRDFMTCLLRVDVDLTTGAFVYDLLTSDVFRTLTGALGNAPSDMEAPQPLLRVLSQALAFIGTDARTRRGLAEALIVLMRPDNAAPALSGAAALLESGALSGVLDLVLDLVTGACRR